MTGRRLPLLAFGMLVVLSGSASADCAGSELTTSTPSVIAGDRLEVRGSVLRIGRCDDTPGCAERDTQRRAAGATLRLVGVQDVDLGEFEPDQDWRRTRDVAVPANVRTGSYELTVVLPDGTALVSTPVAVRSSAFRTATAEPSPRAVPTTAGSPQVQPRSTSRVTGDGLSVAWRLRAVLDPSSEIVIQVDPGCIDDTKVEVDETEEAVLVRVTAPPTVTTCAVRQYLRIPLAEPLGDRQLLHALVDRAP